MSRLRCVAFILPRNLAKSVISASSIERELLDLGLVLAVVRRVVMADGDARQVDAAVRPDPQGDHARGIGLQGQVDQVEPLPFAVQHPQIGEVVVGEGLGWHLRLRLGHPGLILLETLLGLADRGQHQVQAHAVRRAERLGRAIAPGRARRRGCSGRS